MNEDRAIAGALRAKLESRLRDAMRDRDRAAMEALRAALGAVDNAGAVPDDDRTQTERLTAASAAADAPRRQISEAEVRAIVSAEFDDLERAADEYRGLGQDGAAATAEYQASVLLDVLDEPE